ncbi:MAG: 16S rRNA (guanine(966)-N(2))-methyltransferase RsmD [Planctomycetota bacterium]|nr:16S rRNA (guanine(966)-N(2))-methyltransferase RsmD [Planctomycetota bacterium]
MRIIGGIHRSRTILGPKDDTITRPITDRVKTSLFDRLASMGALGDGSVVDVFSGTGSLGLEALSRGAKHCTFIERDRPARQLLEQNIKTLRLTEQAAVLSVNAVSPAWIALLPRKPLALVFLDPPYAMVREPKELAELMALVEKLAPIMEPLGALTLRTPEEVTPPAAAGWDGPASFNYGSMTLHFYSKAEEGDPSSDGKS